MLQFDYKCNDLILSKEVKSMSETKKNDGRKSDGKRTENKTENRKMEPKRAERTERADRAEKRKAPVAKKPESRKSEKNSKEVGLLYKKHPLRRVGNQIYYGSTAEPYIIFMQIKETRKERNLDVASKVAIELQRTDLDGKGQRIVKRSERESLYAAMDIAAIWLERALSGK